MKTIKEKLDSIKKEIREKIIRGDFEVKEILPANTPGYTAEMVISIGGIDFNFTVAKDNYICVHTNPFYDISHGWIKGELDQVLYVIRNNEIRIKESQIKKLEDEIRSLQAK